ncbi:MAG TPA: transglycosylase SLT domain-containing protein [Burkholderiales bacterium]|nr:transglycosylase SLT domain-containing protein [Burkholderiales bacterium]
MGLVRIQANRTSRALIGIAAFWASISAGSGYAGTEDDDFLAAREAFQRGDIARLDAVAPRLMQYPLAGYVTYWQLRSRLQNSQQSDIDAFVAQQGDTLLSQRARIDWLKQLGQRRDWPALLRELAQSTADDVELACYVLQARRARGDHGVAADARPLWFQGIVQPDSCTPVFETMIGTGELSETDIWARVRLALDSGNLTLAKSLQTFLPATKRIEPKQLDAIVRNPQRYLESRALSVKSHAQRELALFATVRLAQTLPAVAANKLERFEARLAPQDRAYVWNQIGLAAALRHRPEALDWFKRGGFTATDRQLGWRARAALRDADWSGVEQAIDAMGERERGLPVWRYWKGRALLAQGKIAEGNAMLAALSVEHHFYAQLASEELGPGLSALPTIYPLSLEEIAAVEQLPSIQRALKFYQLGLRYEGALEWRWATRGLDDRKLLAAAEVAKRANWLDRAIDSADRTQSLHDFNLRYPMPYRDVVTTYARQLALDEAWIYGLVRQESRFAVDARSSAGARGLMQIMPATARTLARRLGLSAGHDQIATIDTNITLGTYYLRHLLDTLDQQPLLATAGYNAGPGRARGWRAEKPLEGAIYAETIPFNETRDYVRKVMSNTMYYSRLIGQQFVTLKQRLGIVAAGVPNNE